MRPSISNGFVGPGAEVQSPPGTKRRSGRLGIPIGQRSPGVRYEPAVDSNVNAIRTVDNPEKLRNIRPRGCEFAVKGRSVKAGAGRFDRIYSDLLRV